MTVWGRMPPTPSSAPSILSSMRTRSPTFTATTPSTLDWISGQSSAETSSRTLTRATRTPSTEWLRAVPSWRGYPPAFRRHSLRPGRPPAQLRLRQRRSRRLVRPSGELGPRFFGLHLGDGHGVRFLCARPLEDSTQPHDDTRPPL